MSYLTHNEKHININGTSLKGKIYCSYYTLVSLFGQPTVGDEYKTDAQWEVEFDDGTVASIYNWKNGKNYCGADGLDVQDINEWNVGGRPYGVEDRIQQVIDTYILECSELSEEQLVSNYFEEA